jgi:hypothetical protein
MDGSIDLDTDTIKVMLVTSAYTPDQDAHDFKEVVTDEVFGANDISEPNRSRKTLNSADGCGLR